jgi:hypothetical protein
MRFLRTYCIRKPQIYNFLLTRPVNLMPALSSINSVLLWSVGWSVMRWIHGGRELPGTLKKPVSLAKEGLINDFSPEGRHTENLQKARNGHGEIKAAQMAYKQANYVENPEATQSFPCSCLQSRQVARRWQGQLACHRL